MFDKSLQKMPHVVFILGVLCTDDPVRNDNTLQSFGADSIFAITLTVHCFHKCSTEYKFLFVVSNMRKNCSRFNRNI